MHVIDYLYQYQNVSFKDVPFNECDALLLALASYFPFDELNYSQLVYRNKDLINLIDRYKPAFDASERKLKYIEIVKGLCSSLRFKDIKFAFYIKRRDEMSAKQFQAITIILKGFVYISFCGTDSTVLGWKEDFNMSYLDTIPSEIEASNYTNHIMRKFPFSKFYLGGHSKGGRLAITALKNCHKEKRVLNVFNFDGPNYPQSFYDEKYQSIRDKIVSYTPNESIIGRLMVPAQRPLIVASSARLLMQHDALTWLIDDNHFVYEDIYSPGSEKIVKSINNAFLNYDNETKKEFVDSLFDLLNRLNIEQLPNEKNYLLFIKDHLFDIRNEWRNTNKESRETIKKITFEIVKDYFFSNN